MSDLDDLPPPEIAEVQTAPSQESAEAQTAPPEAGAGEETEDKGLAHLAALSEIDPDLFEEVAGLLEQKEAAATAPPPAPETPVAPATGLAPDVVDGFNFGRVEALADSNAAQAQAQFERMADDYAEILNDLAAMRANEETETRGYQRTMATAQQMYQSYLQSRGAVGNAQGTREFIQQVKNEVTQLPMLKGNSVMYTNLRMNGAIPNGTSAQQAIQIMNFHLVRQGLPILGGRPLMSQVTGEPKKAAAERLKALRLGLGGKRSSAAGRAPTGGKGGAKLPEHLEMMLKENL